MLADLTGWLKGTSGMQWPISITSSLRTQIVFVIHIYLVTYYLLYLNKLDKEASLITDPPGTSSTALSEKIKNQIRKVKKKLHLTYDTWHMTCDAWHVTCGGGCIFFPNFSSLALTVWAGKWFEDMEDCWMNQLINEWQGCL